MTIYLSPYTDPGKNLAVEAYLRAGTREEFLMVYINDPCVVIGRNQCAEAEADLAFCRDHGIRVIRRISGGGAVYHDRGNLNYSFIRNGDSSLSDGKRDLTTVIAVLREMGIEAYAGKRSELLVRGKKISGTASYCRGGRYIFHGTLLIDSDLDLLRQALDGDEAVRGRKIASVPSDVGTIRTVYPVWDSAERFAPAFVRKALEVTRGRAGNPVTEAGKIEDYYPESIV